MRIHRAEEPQLIPDPWEEKLARLEDAVKATENDGMKARWEMGRELLSRRKGTKLPRGLLDGLVKRLGVARVELQRRMRFAERYPTESLLCHGVTQYPTWHAMVRDGLTVSKRKPAAKRVPTWSNYLDLVSEMSDGITDLRELGNLIGTLRALASKIVQRVKARETA